MKRLPSILLVVLLGSAGTGWADWPMLRGGERHDGYITAELKPPFRLAWASRFGQERLGTAMEPIVAGGRVFVATHGGQLFALDAASGVPAWRFQAQGAFLHSPAVSGGLVVAGSVDGRLYALEANTGKSRWQSAEFEGGFSASPVIAGGRVFIGTRGGEFLALTLSDGAPAWRHDLKVPIRQTAAVADDRVFVTAEDLKVRCFSLAGQALWTSGPLRGQTARDYYPVVVKSGGTTRVIVRTNPVNMMSERITRDRQFLARQAGADDSDWRKLDAWIKSDAARGSPELWAAEQNAVRGYLEQNPEARTCFVLDAETGRESALAPVLWAAGCQGVGTPPTLTGDGRLLVFHRSAYGNWNHGVAPLVSLGLLDLESNRIAPLFHTAGPQPPWNTFWGTADESQNFTVAGQTVLIVHQGTLSGFDLTSNRLFPIHGERDTFGGFRAPAWVRNEWHGPARGGVAVDQGRIFWFTGSRLLCLASGETGPAGPDREIDPAQVAGETAPKLAPIATAELTRRLDTAVRRLASQHWAPLLIEPGLAGPDVLFNNNGALFEALAWALPFLAPSLQTQVKQWLGEEFENFPPYTLAGYQALNRGARRERAGPPPPSSGRPPSDRVYHPFGNLQAIALYADRGHETNLVLGAWPKLKASFEDFERTGWKLDGAKGDPWANRYLGSLLAMARLAERARDDATAERARTLAQAASEALVAWWQRAAGEAAFHEFKGSAELDPFIGQGNSLSFRLAPHRHRLALFHGLSPEVAEIIRTQAGDAAGQVWNWFDTLYRTWPLQGEERQVHFGENFVDSPDLALDAFQAYTWIQAARPGQLARRVDIPFCEADLAYITKLALVLEQSKR